MHLLKKMTTYKIIAVVLCVALIITSIHITSKNEDIYGITNNMLYSFSTSSDKNFNIKTSSVITTYGDAGYATTLKVGENTTKIKGSDNGKGELDGVTIETSFEKLSDSNFISVTYTVKNTNTTSKVVGIATDADIKVADNDKAPISNIDGNRGIIMTDGTANNMFSILLKNSYGVNNVDTYWYGNYGQRSDHLWVSGTQDSTSYSDLTDIDSGMAFSWNNKTLAAGETRTFSFAIGIGEVNNPPTLTSVKLNGTYYTNTSFVTEVTKKTKLVFEGKVNDKDTEDLITIKYAIYNNSDSRLAGPYNLASSKELSGSSSDVSFSVSDRLKGISSNDDYKIKIWAQDSRGAMSTVREFKIKYVNNWLTATPANDINSVQNQVHLDWTPGGTIDTSYKLYRSTGSPGTNKTQIASNSFSDITTDIQVLNVYPIDGSDNLKSWMDDTNFRKPANYPNINVKSVSIDSFNSNPDGCLKSGNSYRYDIVVFGFWDSNGGKDISEAAASSIEKYIIAGNGIIFGHDTIVSPTNNFGKLAKYVNIVPKITGIYPTSADNMRVYDYVRIKKSNIFTTTPFNIEDKNLALPNIANDIKKDSSGNTFFGYIPWTHSVFQQIKNPSEIFLDGWYDYDSVSQAQGTGFPGPTTHGTMPDKQHISVAPGHGYTDTSYAGIQSWYLTVHNNCAMIQTGHTSGQSTLAERMIIANIIYYLYPHASTSIDDPEANDKSSPLIPTVEYDEDKSTGTTIKYKVKTSDKGTDYYYDIEMYDKSDYDTALNLASSNTTVKSGLKELEWCITKGSEPVETICNQKITWTGTSVSTNHPFYNNCTNCGTVMQHDHASPVKTGKCPSGHTNLVWEVDSNSAKCPNCGRQETYIVGESNTYENCNHTGWNTISATDGTNVTISVDDDYNDGTYYLHVRGIDKVGNKGPLVHKLINEAHKVIYDYSTNGGNSATASTKKVNSGKNVDLTPTATKTGDTGTYSESNPDGWQFIGWNTDKDAIKGLTSLKMGSDDITLYAIYKKTITLTEIDCLNNVKSRTRTLKGNVYNTDYQYEFTSDTINARNGWTIRGWTDINCGAPVTWGETWSAGNHPAHETCPDCGTTMNHNHASPAITGVCTNNHTHVIWGEDSNTAICPNCGKTVSYEVAESKFSICSNNDITSPKASVKTSSGGKVKLSFDGTIYALYQKDVTATFIDYSGTTKRTRTNVKTKYCNAYRLSLEEVPTISLYSVGSYNGWTSRGWSQGTGQYESSTLANSSSAKLREDTTFYGQYEKTLTGTFIDYNGTTKRTRTDSQKAYTNSYDVSSVKWPNVTFPIQGNYTGDPQSGAWINNGYSSQDVTDNNAPAGYYASQQAEITKDSTFYGLYRRNITLNYDTHGGNATPSSQSFTQTTNSYNINNYSSKKFTLGVAPSKTGFTHSGWGENSTSGTIYDPESEYTLTHVTTMHSVWTRNSYRVIYDYATNGGTSTTAGSNVYTFYENNIDLSFTAVKNGDTGVYSDSNPDGWQFVGWNTDKDATTGLSSLVMGTEPVTLYAIYKKDITLTQVDANGLSAQKKQTKLSVFNNDNSKSVMLDALTSGSPSYDTVNGDWTIYAWSPSKDAIPTEKYDNKSEFTFTQDVTLYALYEREMINTFVSYDGNTRNSKTVSLPQHMNAYLPEGSYIFPSVEAVSIKTIDAGIYNDGTSWRLKGWAVKPGSSNEVVYAEQETINNVSSGITFYAKYENDVEVEYVDILNGTQQSTKEKLPVICCSNNIASKSYPKLTMKTGNDYGSGFVFSGWTESETNLRRMYDAGTSIILRENLKLYAVYNRDITAAFHAYDMQGEEDNYTNTYKQSVNSSDIKNTIQSIEIYKNDASGTKDSNGKIWNFIYWSKETGNDAEAVDMNNLTITESTDFYAVYETTFSTSFTQIKDNDRNTETINNKAIVNAYDITAPKYETIIVPELKDISYRNETWKKEGYSLENGYDAEVTLISGQKLTVDKDARYYAVYKNTSPIYFIDYDGIDQRKRTINVNRRLNAGTLMPTPINVKTPYLGTYTKDGNWESAGWTTGTTTNPYKIYDENTDSELELNETYYGMYEKNISLMLTSYKNTSSIASTEIKYGNMSVNSYDADNVKGVNFVLPQITDYVKNEKTYRGYGWSKQGNISDVKSPASTINLTKDEHLYAVYNDTITVRYDGNGGLSYTSPETYDKLISASGETSPVLINITGDIPIRSGYKFLDKWSTTTKSTEGTGYTPGEQYEFNNDTVLYAQWGIDTIDKKITINWNDNNNSMGSRPDNVYLTLYRNGEKVLSHLVSRIDDTVSSPVTNRIIEDSGVKITVNKTGNSDEYIFHELQKYNPNSGEAYTYTIQEQPFESLNSQTQYDISINQREGVVTNNIKDAGTKIVKAKIKWMDDTNKWNLRPSVMKLSLIQTDPDTNVSKSVSETIVSLPDKAELFEYTFNGQESINANGNKYEYKIAVDNVSYYTMVNDIDIDSDNVTNCNFVFTLVSIPGSFTGGNRNHIVLSVDPYSAKNHNMPANVDDYYPILSDADRVFMITFKPLKKNIDVSTGAETYSPSYMTQKIDSRTMLPIKDTNSVPSQYIKEKQVIYNVTVTPRYDVILKGLPDGKYEIDPHNDSLFDFDKFAAAAGEIKNAKLTQEDGKWYITFSSLDEYSEINKLHMNVITKTWRGYTDFRETFKHISDRKDIFYKE